MSKAEKVLAYMRTHDRITPLAALNECGCMRLSARITELQRKGYKIQHKPVLVVDQFGDTVRVMSYSLDEEQ